MTPVLLQGHLVSVFEMADQSTFLNIRPSTEPAVEHAWFPRCGTFLVTRESAFEQPCSAREHPLHDAWVSDSGISTSTSVSFWFKTVGMVRLCIRILCSG